MDQHARDTLAAIGLRLADALHASAEELRELRKEHNAVAAAGGAHPGSGQLRRGPPARPARAKPVAALRTRYSGLFDAASSARPPGSMPSSSPPRRKVCRCGHVSRHHDTEHGGCSVCPCSWFAASQLPEEDL